MAALAVAFVAAARLIPTVTAQQEPQYTVWSSVIFSRTGDRTPLVLGDIPTTLTTLGAQQAYSAGQFFRERYIASVPNLFNSTNSTDATFDKAPLWGLSAQSVDGQQLYALALDTQASVASAQAFLQGFYPPYTISENAAETLDPTSVLANGSYVSLTAVQQTIRLRCEHNCGFRLTYDRSRAHSMATSMRSFTRPVPWIPSTYTSVDH